MLLSTFSFCLLLLTVSADSINTFHKSTSTKKPDALFGHSQHQSKPKKQPSHISEFTDPDTGLNPFLDIEEGLASAGRNVMKDDERREDPPFFDFELVEGDSSDRRGWSSGGSDISSKLPVEETLQRWPPFEDKIKEEPSTTANHIASEVPATTESSFEPEHINSFIEQQINEDIRTSRPFKHSILYCSVTVISVGFVAVLIGVCWWRRKVKRTTQSHSAVENGDLER
ncbi:hypothetical protein JTE90_006201 [Oedothorax gibbosus]|uniref:Uncharacterized protein n=1 Tax=Oedothorax gibbosus TaxID=931172 RepID=A0AAV6VV32_9ARAC|nr:hypothetical protein JTE90_006201 [Oedothorax gibbosus]